jgi:hypothetical protein
MSTMPSNRIVLLMPSDKLDKDDAVWVIYRGHEPVLVSGNIENHMSILEDTRRTEVAFDIRQRRPSCFDHASMPGNQRCL